MTNKINYEIIDNFLSEKSFKEIYDAFNCNYFPWYLQNEINHNEKNSPQSRYFTHTFFDCSQQRSEWFYLCDELIEKISLKKLLRIKANLYLSTDKVIEHSKHIDYDIEGTTSLYYVNTNNGHTNLNDEIKVNSIANRFLKFANNTPHNSTTCTDEKVRLNIVINYV